MRVDDLARLPPDRAGGAEESDAPLHGPSVWALSWLAVKVTLLLADAAQAVDGKLYVLGGGWSITGPDPQPMALAIKIEVPWHQANERHTCSVALMDADGQPVELETPDGLKPLELEAQFEVGRPPGVKPGTPLDVVLAVGLGPIPLAPDSRFTWRLSIDGETEEDWYASFTTRPSAAL